MLSRKRLSIVVSVAAFFALVGVPVWWSTTSISRPVFQSGLEEWFADFKARIAPQSVIVRVHAIKTSRGRSWKDAPPPGLLALVKAAASISQTREGMHDRIGKVGIEFSTIDPETCDSSDEGEGVDGKIRVGCAALRAGAGGGSAVELSGALQSAAALERDRPNYYDVFVMESSPRRQGRAYIGDGRVAWIWLGPATFTQDLSTALKATIVTLLNGNQREARGARGPLPTSAASETTLSFALCQADPWPPLTWNFDAWDQAFWQPVRERLAPLMSLETESRIHLFTAPRVQPTPAPDGIGATISRHKLPFFIDSDAWSLDFGRTAAGHAPPSSAALEGGGTFNVAQFEGDGLADADAESAESGGGHGVPQHVLNFVAFVPEAAHRPLRIVDAGVDAEAAFTTPLWGGVAIVNGADAVEGPGSGSGKAETPGLPGRGEERDEAAAEGAQSQAGRATGELSGEAMRQYMGIAVLQLRQLLGLRSAAEGGAEGLSLIGLEAQGVALWELDALMRARYLQLLQESSDTLLSLLKLVKSLPNLEMPMFISDKVGQAKAHLEGAVAAQGKANYSQALQSAREARLCAEVAFSHHSIMALHNYPDQHKLAVYMPLFLPLAVPLFQVLGLELKRLVGHRHLRK